LIARTTKTAVAPIFSPLVILDFTNYQI